MKSDLDHRQSERARAGAALREWRRQREWSQAKLGLAAKAAALSGSAASIVSRWENGGCSPTLVQLDALDAIGAPTSIWRAVDPHPGKAPRVEAPPLPSPPPPAPEPDEEPSPADAAALRVQQLIDSGAPLTEVYTRASRELAGFLTSGLSPDRQRAWTALLKTLKDRVAERGRIMPLHEHPEFEEMIGVILDGVQALPNGQEAIRAVLASVRRKMGTEEEA